MTGWDEWREVVLVDFEFEVRPGERPVPVCLVAHEFRSGRRFRLLAEQLGTEPPYAHGPRVLFVAYYASAELGCYRALGWPMPENILDLFCEFRCRTNGLPTTSGASLLGALAHFGLDHLAATEKRALQQAIGTRTWHGVYSVEEVLDYCETDVLALAKLLPAMQPGIDMPRALLRGRYMAAAAAMEHNGVPLDLPVLQQLREHWTDIQDQLISEIDANYGVYDGRTFKQDRFAAWLSRNNIPWPILDSGKLDLEDDTFRQQAKAHPQVAPLRELRSSLADLRLNDLAVGHDGRNRTMLSAFRARTGRNQPSNSKFIFGPSVWLRGLIKPPAGHGVAYVDWKQQEFAIAAALSNDTAMLAAYQSGDPYLMFGQQAGLIPAGGTKTSHKFERELCKQCVLATQYGMEAVSLAARIGQPIIVARDLLRAHRETYVVFWCWSDAVLDTAMSTNSLHTAYGWHVHVGENPNERSLRNFVVQGNGAEMMRIAACLATERGVEVCAPVHDAFLICAPLDRLDADIALMRRAMAEASRAVLGGFEIGTDVSVVKYPDRYMDERGAVMWHRVLDLLPRQQSRATA
jgi:hypothetical protein